MQAIEKGSTVLLLDGGVYHWSGVTHADVYGVVHAFEANASGLPWVRLSLRRLDDGGDVNPSVVDSDRKWGFDVSSLAAATDADLAEARRRIMVGRL